MKNISKSLTIILIALIVGSCSKDFLDKTPTATLTEGQIIKNKVALNGLVTATYSMLNGLANQRGSRYEYSASCNNSTFGDLPSDDVTKGGGGLGDQGGMEQIEEMRADPTNGDVQQKWQSLYEGIIRANTAIRLLNKSTVFTPTLKNQRLAEVRLLRGYYYFDLKRIFGNVVWLDPEKNTTYDTFEGLKNDLSGDALFEKIEEDYKFAATYLEGPAEQTDKGRVTKGTAYACLAELYVYWKKWPDVISYCDKVDELNYYSLCDNFADNFDPSKDNTTQEAIFQIQHTFSPGSQYNVNIADRLDTYGGPYGNLDFFKPSRNIVNAFATDSATGTPLSGIDISIDSKKQHWVDPRLDYSVFRAGADMFGAHVFNPAESRAVGIYPPFGCRKKTTPLAYFNQSYPTGNTLNSLLIRYANIILWRAEALAESGGSLAEATRLVNEIRIRAANSPVPVDTVGQPFAKYKVEPYASNFTDKDDALNKIRLETRLEFCFEGQRFFDLVRWGIAKQVLDAYFIEDKDGDLNYLKDYRFTTNKNELFPIPQSEIDILGTLTQNPGY